MPKRGLEPRGGAPEGRRRSRAWPPAERSAAEPTRPADPKGSEVRHHYQQKNPDADVRVLRSKCPREDSNREEVRPKGAGGHGRGRRPNAARPSPRGRPTRKGRRFGITTNKRTRTRTSGFCVLNAQERTRTARRCARRAQAVTGVAAGRTQRGRAHEAGRPGRGGGSASLPTKEPGRGRPGSAF